MTDFEKTLLVTLYWPKMKTQIEHFVKKCHPCQSTLPNKIKPPLGKFPLPDRRFSDLHLDVVGPLPESRGYKFLLTIFCRLTRYFTKRSRWPKPWLRSAATPFSMGGWPGTACHSRPARTKWSNLCVQTLAGPAKNPQR